MPRAPRTATAAVPGLAPGTLPDPGLEGVLAAYKTREGLNGKGQIASMIFASRLARREGLPFNVEAGITTDGEGQVKGLGKGSVQTILRDYSIPR